MTRYQKRLALRKMRRRTWVREHLDLFKVAKRLWCRAFGHKQPYTEKMWCSICSRCRIIVEWKEKPLRQTTRMEESSK